MKNHNQQPDKPDLLCGLMEWIGEPEMRVLTGNRDEFKNSNAEYTSSRNLGMKPLMIRALLALSCMLVLLPSASCMTFSTGNASISGASEEVTVPVKADEFPYGLSGYNITVSLSNPAVGSIVSVGFPEWAVVKNNTTLPGASVRILAGAPDDQLGPGVTNVTLANLVLRGIRNGTATINITTYRISAKEGYGNYPAPQTSNGTLTVSGIPPALEIILYPGWNLFSTPRNLTPEMDTAGELFGGIDTAGHSLYTYDASSRTWRQVMSSDPVKPLDAVWIYSGSSCTVQLMFTDSTGVHPTKQIAPGWNLIGFTDTLPVTAHDTLVSVSPIWTTVIGFDAAARHYETSIIRGGSGTHSDSNPLYPGRGYWLYMNGPGILQALSG